MPEIEGNPERMGKKAIERIDELERVVKALIKAMGKTEQETGEALMDEGVYYGIKFE